MRIFVNVSDLIKKIDHEKLRELEALDCVFPIHKPYVDEIYKRNRQAVVLANFRGTFEVEDESNMSEDLLQRLLNISVLGVLRSLPEKEVESLTNEEICKIIERASPAPIKLTLHGASYSRQLGTMDKDKVSPYTIPLDVSKMQKYKEYEKSNDIINKPEKEYENLNKINYKKSNLKQENEAFIDFQKRKGSRKKSKGDDLEQPEL